ncbi:MAG: hypothetical protein IJT94_04445 [Oscillibacter sp.]|nr:hypothetical protein [Oscillibacter sp.]
MIRADELQEFRPQVRYENPKGLNLGLLQNTIRRSAEGLGIFVAFRDDQVKSGGIFNSTIDDCVVMYHPDHERDYFKFCIRVKQQGIYTYVIVNVCGQSTQMRKQNVTDFAREDREGKELSYQIGSFIGQTLFSLGKNKQKLEDEIRYYQVVTEIFDELIP